MLSEHARDLRHVGAETASRRKAAEDKMARYASFDGRRDYAREAIRALRQQRSEAKRARKVPTAIKAIEAWAWFEQGQPKASATVDMNGDEDGDIGGPTEAYYHLIVESAIATHALQCSNWASASRLMIERRLRRSLVEIYRLGRPEDLATEWPCGGLIVTRFTGVVEATLYAKPYRVEDV